MKTLTNEEIASKNKIMKALRFSKKGDKHRADNLKTLRDQNLIATFEAKAKLRSDIVAKPKKETSLKELSFQRNLIETRIVSVQNKEKLTVSEELLINQKLEKLKKILDAQEEAGVDTTKGRALINDTNVEMGKEDIRTMEVKKASKANTKITLPKKTDPKEAARREAEAKAKKEAAEAEEARKKAEEAQKIADELKAKAEKEAKEAKEAEGKLEEDKEEDKEKGK